MVCVRVIFTTIVVQSGLMTHVWELARHLRRAGVEVSIAIETRPRERYGLQVRPVTGVPFHFYENPRQLTEIVGRGSFDLIHAHSSRTFSSVLHAVREVPRPFLITLHGALNPAFFPRTFAACQRIIAVSPEAMNSCGAAYGHKATLLYNGVDLEEFKPEGLTARARRVRILWFGRTHGRDATALAALDRALGMLRKEGLSLQASLIGKAHRFQPRHLTSLGWFDNPIPLLQQSHITFGRGRALREAMACGSVGMLIGEGYGGRVEASWFEAKAWRPLSARLADGYAQADAKQIAGDLRSLVTAPERLTALRKEARQIAERYFDVRAMVRKTIEIYKEVLRSAQ